MQHSNSSQVSVHGTLMDKKRKKEKGLRNLVKMRSMFFELDFQSVLLTVVIFPPLFFFFLRGNL